MSETAIKLSGELPTELKAGQIEGFEQRVEGLDEGIAHYVHILRENGIETYESCEGGKGHAYPEPTVAFHGSASKGYEAVHIALQFGLPVAQLRRKWSVIDGELTGPHWNIVFHRKARSTNG